MKKIERSQLTQHYVAGGCSKGNTATATASGNSTANATVIVHEKIVIRLF